MPIETIDSAIEDSDRAVDDVRELIKKHPHRIYDILVGLVEVAIIVAVIYVIIWVLTHWLPW
jgi:t-SNARE complex subunit (syntaxin)